MDILQWFANPDISRKANVILGFLVIAVGFLFIFKFLLQIISWKDFDIDFKLAYIWIGLVVLAIII
ncbi:hypothetical protein [Campylobacter devanensis]|uniref:hypothetical protein n=1 Tax=Campylobacter devanensis TaxID=3161138 RepID=UPI000A35326C|nr:MULTISPECIES: hypothetical protein [unclassified Campylobacter]